MDGVMDGDMDGDMDGELVMRGTDTCVNTSEMTKTYTKMSVPTVG
jgi:hypothetical protein